MDAKRHKSNLAKTFNAVAEGYDGWPLRFFNESAEYLITLLDLHGNERVLDIATGTGHAALKLAKELPGGFVTGIDISHKMLMQAKKKAAATGINNVNFIEMDMQNLRFPDNHFDLIVCSFGIFFVEDITGQLNHIIKKVKAGGKVLVSTFGENSFYPYIDLFMAHMNNFNVTLSPLTWKRFPTKEQCYSLFDKCNLVNINCVLKDNGYFLSDVDDWFYILYNGGFRGFIDQLSDDDRKKFNREHSKEIKRYITKDGLWLELPVIFIAGIKTD